MNSLWSRDPSGIVIYQRSDYRHIGQWFAYIGVFLGVVGLLLGGVFRGDLGLALALGLGGVGVVFVLVGGLYWFANRHRTFVDQNRRVVRLVRTPHGVPYGDIIAVQTASYVHRVQTNKGTSESLRYQVALLTEGVDAEAAKIVSDIRRVIDEKIVDDNWDQHKIDEMHRDLAALEPRLMAPSRLICSHPNELLIWQLAEVLAKEFDVPLVDLCGDGIVERTPAQLDQPLRERLVREGNTKKPPPTPERCTIDKRHGEVVIHWRGGQDRAVVYGFVTAFVPGMLAVVSAGLQAWTLFAIGCGVTVAVIVTTIVLRYTGRGDTVTVNPTGVCHTTIRRKQKTMSLSALEHIRVNTELHPYVGLLSDNQAIRLHTKEAQEARWLGDALRHSIVHANVELDGPYR